MLNKLMLWSSYPSGIWTNVIKHYEWYCSYLQNLLEATVHDLLNLMNTWFKLFNYCEQYISWSEKQHTNTYKIDNINIKCKNMTCSGHWSKWIKMYISLCDKSKELVLNFQVIQTHTYKMLSISIPSILSLLTIVTLWFLAFCKCTLGTNTLSSEVLLHAYQ